MTPYLATAAHSYGEGNTREERRETQHHVLEAVVAVGFVEGSEHAIEVGLGVSMRSSSFFITNARFTESGTGLFSFAAAIAVIQSSRDASLSKLSV